MKKILLLLLLGNFGFAQSILFKPLSTQASKSTQSHLKSFEMFQFDPAKLVATIDGIPGNVKELTIRTPEQAWTVELFEYDLLSPNYKRLAGGITDARELPKRSDFRTFKGNIKGKNSIVSLSVADGFMKLMIDDFSSRWFIEPLDSGSQSADVPGQHQYLFYKASDIIPVEGVTCGAEQLNEGLKNGEQHFKKEDPSRNKRCVEVKIALVADFTMFFKYKTLVDCENQMLSVMADVQTVFDNEFENEYVYEVTATKIADDVTTDPFGAIFDIGTQLNTFRAIALTLLNGVEHAVATCWSAKYMTGVIGIAFLPGVCSLDQYNVCSDYIPAGGRQGNYLTLQAHELGHNWSCIHDAGISPTIMAPVINGSATWSPLSIGFLNNHVNFNNLIGLCLQECPNSTAPSPEFTSDITYGCQPVTVRFRDLSTNTDRWKWSFPGGTPSTSTDQNPVVIYRTPGKYEVTLEAGNARCSIALTKLEYIEVNDKPVADFSFGINGREVFFIDQSQRAVEYLWKFGDGEESEESNPIHEYQKDTTFEVTLTVTNDCGSHSVKKRLTVVSIPIAEFESDTTGGCAPKNIKFFDRSTNNVRRWEWDFPGGNPSVSLQANPIVRYDNPGVYDVRLTVYSSRFKHSITKKMYVNIDSLPDAEFTHVVNGSIVDFSNQSRYALSHYWDFGDGTISRDQNPRHNYADGRYEVLYIVSNACGNDTAVTIVTIGAKPVAGFQVSSATGCVPYQLQFQNTSTAAATDFRWYFPGGNPSTSTDRNPVVTYNNTGSFDVNLVAYNVQYSDSIAMPNFITVKTSPTVTFSNSITGFRSFFTSQATNATSYFWDFGDNTTSTEENPVHDYGVEGEFDVRLIVQNECGLDTFDKHIAVYLVPKVDYTADTIRGCAPLTVHFADRSSIDVIEWEWLFENGTPSVSSDRNPVVVFDKKGKYTVKLTVRNTNGTNALTKLQYIQVLSPVLCPEYPKRDRGELTSEITENPFGSGYRIRSREAELPLIYPNPAQDYILVYTDATPEQPVKLTVYDLSGRKWSSHTSTEQMHRIQTEMLRGGTYYVKIQDGNDATISKFVISE